MEFQTRSESGGLKHFKTFIEAFEYSQEYKDIWKISWDDQNRWRQKRKCDRWLLQSEEKLCQLSTEYANEPVDSQKIFWVQQHVSAPNYFAIQAREDLTPSEKDVIERLECITEVFNTSAFREKFQGLK